MTGMYLNSSYSASYCKVNSHHQVNLTASSYVVHKGESWVHPTMVNVTVAEQQTILASTPRMRQSSIE